MSGNFVRERQRIVYIYKYYICKQYVAARARNFQTFLGRLCLHRSKVFIKHLPQSLSPDDKTLLKNLMVFMFSNNTVYHTNIIQLLYHTNN